MAAGARAAQSRQSDRGVRCRGCRRRRRTRGSCCPAGFRRTGGRPRRGGVRPRGAHVGADRAQGALGITHLVVHDDPGSPNVGVERAGGGERRLLNAGNPRGRLALQTVQQTSVAIEPGIGLEVVRSIGRDPVSRCPQGLDRLLPPSGRITVRLGQGVQVAAGHALEADQPQHVVDDVIVMRRRRHDAVLVVVADGDVRTCFRHEKCTSQRSGACGGRGSVANADLAGPGICDSAVIDTAGGRADPLDARS